MHIWIHPPPSLELICPVALEACVRRCVCACVGGGGLVKPEGKWRSVTPHRDGSPSLSPGNLLADFHSVLHTFLMHQCDILLVSMCSVQFKL